MKTDFLKELGVSEDIIGKIMAENGKDIEREKSKLTTITEQVTSLTEQLNTAKESLKSFDGVNVEELKGKITELSSSLTEKDTEYQNKIAKIERQGKTKEFLNGKKFINDETKEFYLNKIETLLDGEDSKGKSLDDLLDGMTKTEVGEYKPNIFITEQTKATGLEHGANGGGLTGVEAEFAKLNPDMKIE